MKNILALGLFTLSSLAQVAGATSVPCSPGATQMETMYTCDGGVTKIEVNQCNLNDVQLVSKNTSLIDSLKKAGAYPSRNRTENVNGHPVFVPINDEALFRGTSRYSILSIQNLGSFEQENKQSNSFSVYRHLSGYKLAVRSPAVDYNVKPAYSWYLPKDEIFSWYFGDCKATAEAQAQAPTK